MIKTETLTLNEKDTFEFELYKNKRQRENCEWRIDISTSDILCFDTREETETRGGIFWKRNGGCFSLGKWEFKVWIFSEFDWRHREKIREIWKHQWMKTQKEKI